MRSGAFLTALALLAAPAAFAEPSLSGIVLSEPRWPEGDYRADLFIDGKPAARVPFKVAK